MGNRTFPFAQLPNELRCLLFSLVLLLPQLLSAQILKIDWDFDYGGNIWEDCNSAEETSDGGYILGGYTSSTVTGFGDIWEPPFDGFFPPPDVGDYWIVKTDDRGVMDWNRRYGGNKQDRLWAAQETPDGGYILAGVSNSDAGPQKSDLNRGYEDYWIIKVDSIGDIEWDRSYGSDSTDYFYSLLQTSDGGFLLGGISKSDIGFEKSEARRGHFDMWFVKTDSLGNKLWDKTIGGNDEERLNEMQETPDGHYIIAGATASDRDNIDITKDGLGGKDSWLIKIDSTDGNKIWEYRYGGTEEDEIQSFTQSQEGGLLLGGGSRSPVSAMKKKASQWVDFWIMKVDGLGTVMDELSTIQWEETFGGPELDNCYSVKQNNIGNYIVAGYSASDICPDKTEANRGPVGTEDFWLLYLAPDGTKLWDKTLGGDNRDVLENIFQTSDGGYLLAGHSSSPASGDKKTDNNGLNDFWIIKTLCNVSVEFNDTIICPNTDVFLDATDENCIQCSWEWEDGVIDSTRTLTINQNTSYAVTLVDGVGCSWTDDIAITTFTPPVLDLGGDLAICEGDTALIGTSMTGVDFDWSTGAVTNSIRIDTAGNYRLIVTDANSCTARDSIDLTLNALPEVNIGNDTSVCLGETFLLDAENPGAQYSWSPAGSMQTLNALPPSPFTYAVTVTDANNCTAADTMEVLNVYTQPLALGLVSTCNELNTAYTVSFTIAEGDLASYAVTGGPGSLVGNVFTSDPIPRDQAYQFFLDDDNNCGPTTINGSYDCGCETLAGTLVSTPLTLCGDQSITIAHGGNVLDQDDILRFILHDGDATNIGNVLLSQVAPTFQYDPVLVYGTTYYIVAVAGNDNGGEVNLLDGCLSQSNAVPVVFYDSPTALIISDLGTQVTCQTPNLILSATFSQPVGGVDFLWSTIGMGNIIGPLDQPVVDINAAGTYQVLVTDQISGCTDTDQMVIGEDAGVPDILVADPAIFTCKDTLIPLDGSGSSSGSPYLVEWLGGNIDGSSDLNPLVNAPGIYTLMITNQSNGCTVTEVVTVLPDTIGPLVSAGNIGILDCIRSVTTLAGTYDPTCSTCTFSWETSDGNFTGGVNTLSPSVNLPGTYRLSVLNANNGCSTTDEVLVIEDPTVPTSADLQINPPLCFGEEDGSIEINRVNGGLSPYLYSLDGFNFFPNNEFVELPPGNYRLFIQDAKGCEWDSLLYIGDALPLMVELGEEQTIDLGEEIELEALTNRPVDSVLWIAPETFACEDCLEQVVRPLKETNYGVTVTDANGCTVSDYLLVRVRKERNVFIPNAFSSDFNGTNDYFTVFADKSVKQVLELRVYTRWGELAFERKNFQPNIETQGWDGTMNGQALDPGIYTYYAMIEFIDGEELIYEGGVLLTK